MTHRFDPAGRLVIVEAVLAGPTGYGSFTFAVDTGCSRTAVSGTVLRTLGYGEPAAGRRFRVRTGSGGTQAGMVEISFLAALGQSRTNHSVLWLPLPPATMIAGLLGLDYFRGQRLALDFARGRIALGAAKSWWPFWK